MYSKQNRIQCVNYLIYLNDQLHDFCFITLRLKQIIQNSIQIVTQIRFVFIFLLLFLSINKNVAVLCSLL